MSYDRNALRPLPGTLWAWEPRAEHARALVEVTSVRWNGEEWFVGTKALLARDTFGAVGDGEICNDLDRFWEACHYVAPEAGAHACAPLRSGAPVADELRGEPV